MKAAREAWKVMPELMEPATRLAEHRTATGTPSTVVPVQDVYAVYGHGARAPDAIRADHAVQAAYLGTG